MSKQALNEAAQAGANWLTAGAAALLLEDMAEIPLNDPRAEIAGADPPEDEDAWFAGAQVERANLELVTPHTRWQSVVTLARTANGGQGVVYGPCNRPGYVFDEADADGNGFAGDVTVGGKWYRNQRPMKGVELERPDDPASWACSTAANVIWSCILNAGPKFRRANGANMLQTMTRPSSLGGFAEYFEPAFGGRSVSWSDVLTGAAELGHGSLAFIAFRSKKTGKWREPSHVVTLLRCGAAGLRLHEPESGEQLTGLYRFGADGYYRDRPSFEAVRAREPGARREYSCKRTTLRPVSPDDSGRAIVYRAINLRPDGRTPFVKGGVYHENQPSGFRVLSAA